MQQLPSIPSVLGNLNTYNAKPITGEEAVDVLQRTKDSALRMMADEALKASPQGWKTMLTHWVVTNSDAYYVWLRPDLNSVGEFFDRLIERKKVSSTLYNDNFHKHILELVKPKSMDSHYIEMYDYHNKVFDNFIISGLSNTLDQQLNIDRLLVDPIFTRGNGIQIKETLINHRELQKVEIVKQCKTNFTEQSVRLELQALVAADPELFQHLDRDQSPADSTASQLTDMFQTKILRSLPNGPFNIMLKTSQNIVSPLVKVNQSLASQATAAINSAQQTQIQHPVSFPNQKGSGKRGNPIIIQSQASQKKARQTINTNNSTNNNNNSSKQKKFCNFCKTTYPKSKTCDTHYSSKCYRNPASLLYDAVKAANPPKN